MDLITDEWVVSQNLALILRMKEIAKGSMSVLQQMLLLAEVDSVVYNRSPSVNLLLSDTYIGLPEEISLEFRQRIEEEKLNEISQGRLTVNSYVNYLDMNNARRAVYHLNKGIRKSEDNPQRYESLVKLTLGRIALDKRVMNESDMIQSIHNLGSTAHALRTYR